MNNWRDELVADIHAELGAKPAIAMLATADRNIPDARSVVVRQVRADGALQIVSDSRSSKNAQLKSNPSATAVFWFARLRRQYRIAGEASLITADDPDSTLRLAAWKELSDSARALFYWPACGEIRREVDDFPKAVDAEAAMPDCFEVLVLSPQRVEILDLNPHPHLRLRWSNESGTWTVVSVNP